jgi:4'-phosphopantetheinyl transferase EntD
MNNDLKLKSIIPESIEYKINKISDFGNEQIFHTEQKLVEKSCPKRKKEFVAGRITAKYILQSFGVENFPILTGKFREPVWPLGIVGSISHCSEYCFVAASSEKYTLSLGVDIEPNEPIAEELINYVLTDKEKDWIQYQKGKGGEGIHWSKAIFSAKESAYKCVFPLLKKYIDFKEVQTVFQPEEYSFRVNFLFVPHPGHLYEIISKVEGYLYSCDKFIYTLAVLPRSEAKIYIL